MRRNFRGNAAGRSGRQIFSPPRNSRRTRRRPPGATCVSRLPVLLRSPREPRDGRRLTGRRSLRQNRDKPFEKTSRQRTFRKFETIRIPDGFRRRREFPETGRRTTRRCGFPYRSACFPIPTPEGSMPPPWIPAIRRGRRWRGIFLLLLISPRRKTCERPRAAISVVIFRLRTVRRRPGRQKGTNTFRRTSPAFSSLLRDRFPLRSDGRSDVRSRFGGCLPRFFRDGESRKAGTTS